MPRPGPGALVRAPHPVKELDFSPGGPYALYNWELFFHVPLAFMLLAALIAETMIHMTAELLDADADEAEALVERSRQQLLLISLSVPIWGGGDRTALIEDTVRRELAEEA